MTDVIYGIQLYSLRDLCQTPAELEKTLMTLHDHGVDTVQLSAIGPVDWINELPGILKRAGMRVPVTHTSFARMLSDTDAVIDEHLAIGCDLPGIGGMPTEEGISAFLRDAQTVCERMKKRGLQLAYHNHDFDLRPIDGQKIVDRILRETELWFIPDVAWIRIAGEDPVERLRLLKGRVKTVHLKDYLPDEPDAPHPFCELGKGLVDLPACARAMQELDMPFALYEQDSHWAKDPMSSALESWAYMSGTLAKL